MCVICYTGKTNISNDVIKQMWESNPDGAGFAWIEGNEAHYSKGFMRLENLLSALPENRQYLMIHFRIATSGNIDSEHCHPFNFQDVRGLQGKASHLLFHNGMVSVDWKESKKDIKTHSDTWLFVRSILSQVNSPKVRDYILTNESNFSKFALFDSEVGNNWLLYGKWEDYQGMKVSNLGFSYPKTVHKFYPMYGYKSDFDWDMVDDENIVQGGNEESFLEEGVLGDECLYCHEVLQESDLPYQVCLECATENGISCDCGNRISYNDTMISGLCFRCEENLYSHYGG